MNVRRLLSAVLLLSFVVPMCCAADRGPSTPEEKARAVEITKKLEANPLDENLRSDREWLLKFAIEVPDISVSICPSPLYDALPKKYKYGPELTAQILASSLVFAIEHPEKAADKIATYQAGLEGALRAYEAIVKQNPKARVDKVDALIKTRDNGGLADYVKTNAEAKCKG